MRKKQTTERGQRGNDGVIDHATFERLTGDGARHTRRRDDEDYDSLPPRGDGDPVPLDLRFR